MKVLTIIVSYNFMPWIDHCLGSLKNSAYPTDVIVIDNASSDATVTTLGQRYPWVKLVANDSNLGFGRANNIGIQYAIKHQYDAVLLLNQDAWIEPDTLDKLVNAAQRHPDYGIVSPLHLTGQGDGLDKGFAHYTGIKDLHLLPGDEIVQVPFINAAIWFISLEVLKRVGLFDITMARISTSPIACPVIIIRPVMCRRQSAFMTVMTGLWTDITFSGVSTSITWLSTPTSITHWPRLSRCRFWPCSRRS